MPKKKIKLLVRAYEKNDVFFAELSLLANSHDEVYKKILELVDFFASGKFSHVNRLDLISCGRVLFSFCDLRETVNQKNLYNNYSPFKNEYTTTNF